MKYHIHVVEKTSTLILYSHILRSMPVKSLDSYRNMNYAKIPSDLHINILFLKTHIFTNSNCLIFVHTLYYVTAGLLHVSVDGFMTMPCIHVFKCFCLLQMNI